MEGHVKETRDIKSTVFFPLCSNVIVKYNELRFYIKHILGI